MYSMNWVTYSFMRTRHVSVLVTLWGDAMYSDTGKFYQQATLCVGAMA